ncbi:glutamate-1-semialdehyde 2,1-aminomutase [Candidatus Nanopelagicus limnes]|uniref:Glutamate-1-semialdehyde 2,1-aminomutase n=1 Tax=Candidatus Nanopelagicus limnae TaxID=1884634 RepID=A0A249JXM8_9ACTN|nr:transaminase [Candidatus Nanopelagicus limnes]ASY09284.1 glutamate-1-semialdehyde 2,1-aminomutase [Candidatus Nanopelagicus limnes]
MINRGNLIALRKIEDQRFLETHKKSGELFAIAKDSMPNGVPMSWMSKWPGAYPVFVAEAKGASFVDVDGNTYIDFCLGDTGSMTGHSPEATVAAIREQVGRGLSVMLPTKDAADVSTELTKRFGVPLWQFTVSATDANRHVIRYSRLITKKSKIIVIDRCYHGSVDETFATLDASGKTVSREGNIGAPIELDKTTRVVPFNDLDAMKKALQKNDVAAILMEPAMTNVGIVLPVEGYLKAVEKLAREFGAKLIIDETHTISVGPGGMTAQLGLQPDFLTIGKAIGGGFPTGAFGMSAEIAKEIKSQVELEVIDTGGVGGTLAANALSLAAMRATLTKVLTEENFEKMIKLGTRWADGVEKVIEKYKLPWSVNRLGARAEYMFSAKSPTTGREAADAGDFELEQYIHLRMLNDGFLITPFHNMALISPDTTAADVDAHTQAFDKMCGELIG